MNALHNEQQKWIGDGSSGRLSVEDNAITMASASPGTPFNARLESAKTTEAYCFQVQLMELKGNISVGVVSKDEFRPGWKTKGMFYNGNLTNGSAALKTGWGPRFQAGDSLGVRVSPQEHLLEVTYFKNGASLGTGFRLENSNNVYFPCLHVSGEASLIVEFPQNLPPTEVLEGDSHTGFIGDWKLVNAWDGESPVSIPHTKNITLHLAQTSGDSIQMSFKVCNSLNGRAKVLQANDVSTTIETSPFAMTKMMPPQELIPIERLLSTKKMTTLQLDTNGTLVIAGPEMRTDWNPFVRTAAPLERY